MHCTATFKQVLTTSQIELSLDVSGHSLSRQLAAGVQHWQKKLSFHALFRTPRQMEPPPVAKTLSAGSCRTHY